MVVVVGFLVDVIVVEVDFLVVVVKVESWAVSILTCFDEHLLMLSWATTKVSFELKNFCSKVKCPKVNVQKLNVQTLNV